MGTRMLKLARVTVHDNWKQSVLEAAETDTVLVRRGPAPAMRVLRTQAAIDLNARGLAGGLDRRAPPAGGPLLRR